MSNTAMWVIGGLCLAVAVFWVAYFSQSWRDWRRAPRPGWVPDHTWHHISSLVNEDILQIPNSVYRIQFDKVAYVGCTSQPLGLRLWDRERQRGHLVSGPVRKYLEKGHQIREIKVLEVVPDHKKRFWRERYYIHYGGGLLNVEHVWKPVEGCHYCKRVDWNARRRQAKRRRAGV